MQKSIINVFIYIFDLTVWMNGFTPQKANPLYGL